MLSENRVQELEMLRESGLRLSRVLQVLIAEVRPGVTTGELGKRAEELILEAEGTPIFKGYGAEWGKPFPAAVCTSINNEVVHGIPDPKRVICDGDLVKLDIGLRYRGMVTDMARTVPVGKVSEEALRLVRVTEESLKRGIATLREGSRLSEYAEAVQKYVEGEGFSVVRDLVGHGVGHELHEEPQVPNYLPRRMHDMRLTEGLSLALEPMVNAGRFEVKIASDGWTFVTVDGSLSAHFEDTVIVGKDEAEVVTRFR